MTQRLTQLDDSVARRWPRLMANGPADSLRWIVVYQVIAVVEIAVGAATGSDLLTGLAVAPLILGIGAAWRLLHPAGDRAP